MMKWHEMYRGEVVLTDRHGGAVLGEDELWYPFRYLSSGELDIYDIDGGYIKPSMAYKMAKLIFT